MGSEDASERPDASRSRRLRFYRTKRDRQHGARVSRDASRGCRGALR